jgi:hypothetical protein
MPKSWILLHTSLIYSNAEIANASLKIDQCTLGEFPALVALNFGKSILTGGTIMISIFTTVHSTKSKKMNPKNYLMKMIFYLAVLMF